MLEELLGSDNSQIITAVIALVVVLALIFILAKVWQKLFGSNTAMKDGHGPRLKIVDALTVDSKRRLLIVRRDNVDNLVMIGGPNDFVIESGIQIATAQPRPKMQASISPAQAPQQPKVQEPIAPPQQRAEPTAQPVQAQNPPQQQSVSASPQVQAVPAQTAAQVAKPPTTSAQAGEVPTVQAQKRDDSATSEAEMTALLNQIAGDRK